MVTGIKVLEAFGVVLHKSGTYPMVKVRPLASAARAATLDAAFVIVGVRDDFYKVSLLNDDGTVKRSVDVTELGSFGSALGVNWGANGTNSVADTKKFAALLDLAAKVADKANALLGKES